MGGSEASRTMLGNALNIGRSGLLASQAGIETAGNNLANIATRGYHRQSIALASAGSQKVQSGVFIGKGVEIDAITRQVNEALEGRLRNALSDEAGTAIRQGVLEQLEAIQNELSDADLSTQLGRFFNAFSELANNPQDASLRSLAIQEADVLSTTIQTLRQSYGLLRNQLDHSAGAAVVEANDLLRRIEQVNDAIITSEGPQGGAAGLRDQRDVLLSELSKYMDISVNEQDSGSIDVFVGSKPVMLDGRSRGVELLTTQENGDTVTRVVIADNKDPLEVTAGELGAMVSARKGDVQDAIDTLDNFAHEIIWQVNRLHSQGQGTKGFPEVTGTTRVADTTVALNDADAGLEFTPQNGSFVLHVKDTGTGRITSTRIAVDLDGVDPANNTSLDSLVAAIDAVAGVSAEVGRGNQLVVRSDAGNLELTFSEDSSGVLAALGVNTLFSGSNAVDMAVNQAIIGNPQLLAAALENVPGDNRTALAIAGLRDQKLSATGGFSLTEVWSRHVEDFAIRQGQAKSQLQADQVVREALESQQQSVSGVNADEEAINLLAFQRAYQASARFLNVVNELMDTLMSLA